MTENLEFDRKDLKVQALLERVSQLTAQYENQVADLRVALTISEDSVRRLTEQVEGSKGVEEAEKSKKTK